MSYKRQIFLSTSVFTLMEVKVYSGARMLNAFLSLWISSLNLTSRFRENCFYFEKFLQNYKIVSELEHKQRNKSSIKLVNKIYKVSLACCITTLIIVLRSQAVQMHFLENIFWDCAMRFSKTKLTTRLTHCWQLLNVYNSVPTRTPS